MSHEPTRGEIISALNRMAHGAREHGHYSFCRLDAAWAEAAIKLMIRDYDALNAVVEKHGGLLVSPAMKEAAALAGTSEHASDADADRAPGGEA